MGMYRTKITDSCAIPDRLEAINETLLSIVSILSDATDIDDDAIRVRLEK